MLENNNSGNMYLSTEVGNIPKGWKIKTLGDLFNFSGGFTASRDQLSNKGFCYLHYGDIHMTDKTYIDVEKEYLDIPKLNVELKKVAKSSLLNDGDVVFVDASEDDDGVSKHIVVRNTKEINYISGLHTIVAKSKGNELDNLYKQFCFKTSNIKKQFKFYAVGTKVSGISKSNVKNILIPVPDIKEQKAIATALSDMDDLILSLEKLINKKKLIKEGAMEELLTGKKRLDGFNDEWKSKKFNEVCWFQEGPGLRNWQFTNSGMKVINVTNLEFGYLNLSKTDRHISLEEFNKMYKHFEIDEHDIVMASSGNSYGKVAIVRKQDLPLLMNTSVIRFKPINKLNYNFLLQFLKSKLFISQINLLITGGAQPNFGPAHLNKIEINLPVTIEEQMVIGNILSDMDKEIEKLEKKLDKYKSIKSGMMEELLTGKRRLV
ncbi:restriction endonuclease subunit S [Clostridium sp.]|uniref:restriction endonuclease subunit S n=1 Tax=Clostridium sp. TaxID=1506 RepID=UPI0025B8F07E|nr:restriction endonuclease subunit S [Clostridium sp.]